MLTTTLARTDSSLFDKAPCLTKDETRANAAFLDMSRALKTHKILPTRQCIDRVLPLYTSMPVDQFWPAAMSAQILSVDRVDDHDDCVLWHKEVGAYEYMKWSAREWEVSLIYFEMSLYFKNNFCLPTTQFISNRLKRFTSMNEEEFLLNLVRAKITNVETLGEKNKVIWHRLVGKFKFIDTYNYVPDQPREFWKSLHKLLKGWQRSNEKIDNRHVLFVKLQASIPCLSDKSEAEILGHVNFLVTNKYVLIRHEQLQVYDCMFVKHILPSYSSFIDAIDCKQFPYGKSWCCYAYFRISARPLTLAKYRFMWGILNNNNDRIEDKFKITENFIKICVIRRTKMEGHNVAMMKFVRNRYEIEHLKQLTLLAPDIKKNSSKKDASN